MTRIRNDEQPDWDARLSFELTPDSLATTLFATATDVHTGWQSCVDDAYTIQEAAAVDDRTGNHCRFVEQEYNFDDSPDVWWHDWTVELKVGDVYVAAHWQVRAADPLDIQWAGTESEKAFVNACAVIGKRVYRTFAVESPPQPATRPGLTAPTRHH